MAPKPWPTTPASTARTSLRARSTKPWRAKGRSWCAGLGTGAPLPAGWQVGAACSFVPSFAAPPLPASHPWAHPFPPQHHAHLLPLLISAQAPARAPGSHLRAGPERAGLLLWAHQPDRLQGKRTAHQRHRRRVRCRADGRAPAAGGGHRHRAHARGRLGEPR